MGLEDEVAELRARLETLERAVDRRRFFRRAPEAPAPLPPRTPEPLALSAPSLPADAAPADAAPADPAPTDPAPVEAVVVEPDPLPEPTTPPEALLPVEVVSALVGKIIDSSSTAAAVSGSTSGKGSGVFGSAAAGSPAAGVKGVSAGSGSAVIAQTTRATNVQPTLRANHAGAAPAISAVSTRGVGATLQGAAAAVRLVPQKTKGSPTGGSHLIGELIVDSSGTPYLCTSTGNPGTWRKLRLD